MSKLIYNDGEKIIMEITKEELEEKIFPTKVEIKSSTTQPQDAAIKQPTPTIAAPEDTKSAFISHKEKFKEILSTDQSVITPSKR